MNTRKKKFYRILSVYLVLNLLAQICMPTAAFALTNGPGQPEFQSFEPAGTTEMVNLFTGDFNYNIPLMTVPGPNGGYPINLAYHAGISMEQEASWVGLGWNINAGAINRSMRGLPDDFDNEQVVKQMHFKPNTNFSFSYGPSIADIHTSREIFGISSFSLGTGVSLYYNNYRGIGLEHDFGLSRIKGDKLTPVGKFCSRLTLNTSTSSDGIGVNLGFALGSQNKESPHTNQYISFPSLGLSWGSREGIKSISFDEIYSNGGYPFGAGISFAKSSYVPASTPEMAGYISMLGVSIGNDSHGKFEAIKATSLDANLSRSWIKYETQRPNSFGYLYADQSNAINDENILEDLNIEKDIPPSREVKTIGVPVSTYDVYNVSAQGAGGSFRPYRSDIGVYTEPKVISTIRGAKVNTEFGMPDTDFGHFGTNSSYTQSQTYSGIWYNHFLGIDDANQGWNNALGDYIFQGLDANGARNSTDHLYEPFYFKMSGEQTAEAENQLDAVGGEDAVRYKLNELFETSGDGIAVRPEISSSDLYTGNTPSETPTTMFSSQAGRLYREKRIESNQYYTNSQMDALSASEPLNLYGLNEFPATGSYTLPAGYDYSANSAKQIGAFTEVNPDGNRYVYGIPLKTTEKEVSFAFPGDQYPSDYINSDYSTTDRSVNNVETGTDQFYSSTELPAYASSYLLTAIYSPDYVDVTGDGPTDDDMGYFVKFNYVRTNTAYKWRAPYWGAIRNAGFLSDENDDKLSYEFGTKEIYLLHSIETKTHVACFVLQNHDRKDAHEAIAEGALDDSSDHSAVSSSDGMRALDHISLYSKADPDFGTSNATPLKSVYFTYDYSLCAQTINNENNYGSGTSTGKLTLKSFYFTYRNNTKGQLNPYQFDYVDMGYESDLRNPDFNVRGNDRWGNYKKFDPSEHIYNNENPYVDQKGINRKRVNQSAAAWCLKKITLPSGSTINVNYEADDYAYIQDKPVTEMCRVVGTLTTSQNQKTEISDKIDNDHVRICFELDTTYSASASISEIAKYLANINDMYFKIFMRLKKPFAELSGDPLYDYVTGYCKLDLTGTAPYGFVEESGGPRHYGYFTVKLVDRDDYPSVPGFKSHPYRKAAVQYIYLDRPDLFSQPNNIDLAPTVANLAVAATSMITEIPRAVAPYTYAFARGWGKEMDIDNSTLQCNIRPSYVRLSTPDGIKAGGGHRVKSIVMSDNWNNLSGSAGADAKYGISYNYCLPDGRSSGVAAYEPMIGGDEIALHKPIRYNSDNLIKNDAAFYVEEPMGESYFPAPVVGYSRVIVKSIVGNADAVNPLDQNKDEDSVAITKSRTGQTVYEFYTAKDFPVITDRTDLDKTWFPIPVIIPFIGAITYNHRGFSQGFSVVLNDMHGKLKSVSTYSSKDNLNLNPIPVRRVEYKYKTDSGGHLNNQVDVLTADGEVETAALGETYDFYNDLRQHSNETLELGGQFNTETQVTSGFTLPILLPTINISRSLYRSAATMKVIYRTGILTEVNTIDDGASSKAENLLFDAETGAPLLTTVTNEFEKPVYTYNYAAHWTYDGMKGAYNNIGARYNSMTTNISGQLTGLTNADLVFFPGDEVMYLPASGTAEILTVSNVGSTNITLIHRDGTAAASLSTGDFIISRSGHRNMQSVSNGVIVSLSDPTQNRNFPLFTSLNAIADLEEGTYYNFIDCATGNTETYSVIADDHSNALNIHMETGCEASIMIPIASFDVENIDQFDGCDFTKNGNKVTIDFPSGPDVIGTWVDNNHCFNECIDNVLHASATRFLDNWTMDFDDVGVSPATTNEYVLGEKGVWRTESNYLYQVDRKQSTVADAVTDISKDGTYKNFVLYNWTADPQDNKQWSYVSKISRYSPYGYALESRDALGIYSASMFGYDNTKQTAAASNCQYFELGNDAFEDYGTTAYSSSNGHGHLFFPTSGSTNPSVSTDYAHTGKSSLKVAYASDAVFTSTAIATTYSSSQQYFAPIGGGKYNLSLWARATGGTPAVVIDNGTPTTYTPDLSQSPIEGWYHFDINFTAPAASSTLTITLKCQASGTAYFDDVRLQPFTSAMVSYVYDPQTHWLLAELDNRNFATLYNYDEEGSVVQVKQETEKGIFTIKTARSNVQH